jgi:hypothetical protein
MSRATVRNVAFRWVNPKANIEISKTIPHYKP